MIWAHNGHVSRETYPDAPWVQAGALLRKKYGRRYYAIGQCFLQGSFAAVDGDDKTAKEGKDTTSWKRFTVDAPKFPSIAAMFSEVGPGNYIIDFDHARTNQAMSDWLINRQEVRECATWFADSWKEDWDDGVAPGKAYDAMTFIHSTTAADSLRCSDSKIGSKVDPKADSK